MRGAFFDSVAPVDALRYRQRMFAELLTPGCATVTLAGSTKAAVLREMAELFVAGDAAADVGADAIAAAFEARERLASTGVGDGVAIPHGRLDGLPAVRLALGVHREGVRFEAIDGRPVHLFVGVLAPTSEPGAHLRVLRRVSLLFREESVRVALRDAPSAEAAREVLLSAERRLVG